MIPFTFQELNEQVDAGNVKATRHPEFPLTIYNYSNKCQYDSAWNKVTNLCRGLILDDDFNIIARPFSKFHNYSEHVGQGKELPDGPIEVTEKMDGSLGILYWWKGEPYIATRGSFNSEQAIEGTKMFKEWWDKERKYPLAPPYTWLFEIIYPQNRIVVNYNSTKLVLLSVLDNSTGVELPIPYWYPIKVLHHDYYNSVAEVLAAPQGENREGFVIRFPENNNLRLKIKFDEYVRLHRLLTQTSARDIWDLLRNNKPLDELLDLVPDEFYGWVQSVTERLTKRYESIYKQAFDDYICWDGFKYERTRKDFALYAQTCEYPGLMFLKLDGKDDRMQEQIWKMIRPEHEIPFKVEI